MSRKRNTQIPEEAIECAAGINDQFTLKGSVTQVICEKEVTKPNKKNTKTIMPNSVSRSILSTELAGGMSIKTENTPSAEQGRE